MEINQFSRTGLVMGPTAIEKLSKARVAVFGVGGVGGNAIEALARAGIGTLDLIDNDTVAISNINRQLFATHATVDQYKVDAAKERLLTINPQIQVNTYPCFYLPNEKEKFDFTQYDYILDAIDTVTAKLDIIQEAKRCGTPIICAMGCGNRVDPTKLVVTDIYQTTGDPLAKIMRRELRKRGVKKLKVVYSIEPPITPMYGEEFETKGAGKRPAPGSTPFVPSTAGIIMASVVVRDLLNFDPENR